MIKTPNRVNQDVLRKAIASSNDETALYNNLLLKQANDWRSVKTCNIMTEEIDLAASNAHEITQMLWKTYHRSQSHVSTKEIPVDKHVIHHRRRKYHKEISNASFSLIPESLKSETANPITEQKRKETQKQGYAYENRLNAVHGESIAVNISSQVGQPTPLLVGSTSGVNGNAIIETPVNQNVSDDEESLEEGEIRDSPCGSPKDATVHSNLTELSDVSSSEHEDETDLLAHSTPSFSLPLVSDAGSVSSYYQYYQHQPPLVNEDQNYHDPYYHVHYPNYDAATLPEQTQSTELTYDEADLTIEVSDDEPTLQEPRKTNECNGADGVVIISVHSEESGDESLSLNDRIESLRSSRHEKSKARRRMHGVKDKLCLQKVDGLLTSWPASIARSGSEILWKWWRTYIENNNGSLGLYHPCIGHIDGAIPSICVKKGTHIVVPKIVDDMQQFLKCLGETKFPNYCPDVDVSNGDIETFRNSKKKSVNPNKLRPLAEELSRGSVKRINFEICKKKRSYSAPSNRISIRDFASIRNLTAKATKRSNLDHPCETETNRSSNLYSYGEQLNASSIRSSDRSQASPLGLWVTAPGTDSQDFEEKSPRRSSSSAEQYPYREGNPSLVHYRSRKRDHSAYQDSATHTRRR